MQDCHYTTHSDSKDAPDNHELSACRASLVSPHEHVLSIPMQSIAAAVLDDLTALHSTAVLSRIAGVLSALHIRNIPPYCTQAGHLALSTRPPPLCDSPACQRGNAAAGRSEVLPFAAGPAQAET